jgi:hypothetical protein
MAITGRHPTPTPLALSDAQITTTMGLARPLQPQQRTAFLEMIAAKLNGRREIGDGQLHRLCVELRRKLFDPPNLAHEHAPRWSSRRRNGVQAAADG